jgi:hypothetical protein
MNAVFHFLATLLSAVLLLSDRNFDRIRTLLRGHPRREWPASYKTLLVAPAGCLPYLPGLCTLDRS